MKKKTVKVAYLTAADENILSSPNLISTNSIIVELLKRKVLENLCWNLSFKDKSVAQVSLKGGYQAMFKAPKNGTISELLGSLGSNQNSMRQRHMSYH